MIRGISKFGRAKIVFTYHSGLVGFARLAPGDVFEVNLKCGTQKWKSKGRVGLDRNQVWDADLVIFRCLLEDMLEIKVIDSFF